MTRDEGIQFLQGRPASEPVLIVPATDPAALLMTQFLIFLASQAGDAAGAEGVQTLQRQMQTYRADVDRRAEA